MWPISAANIGAWLAIILPTLGLISTLIYTQNRVAQHDDHLGIGSPRPLRERVLKLETDVPAIEKVVERNREDALRRHGEVMDQLRGMGQKLDHLVEIGLKTSRGDRRGGRGGSSSSSGSEERS